MVCTAVARYFKFAADSDGATEIDALLNGLHNVVEVAFKVQGHCVD
jgi:hypothetical protein